MQEPLTACPPPIQVRDLLFRLADRVGDLSPCGTGSDGAVKEVRAACAPGDRLTDREDLQMLIHAQRRMVRRVAVAFGVRIRRGPSTPRSPARSCREPSVRTSAPGDR